MKSVFVLQHSYEQGDCDETKFIGVYSTQALAEAAIARLSLQPGFKYRPEAFCINEYALDQDHWTEGYATILHVCLLDKEGNKQVVAVECLPDDRYQLNEYDEPEILGDYRHGDIVTCEERDGEVWVTGLIERAQS